MKFSGPKESVQMNETTFTREATSNRDIILAGMMLLSAVAVFWYLDGLFHVSAYLWYSLFYVAILSPFLGLVLHARPLSLKLTFLMVMTTAIFLS
jgi:hypothetical protein